MNIKNYPDLCLKVARHLAFRPVVIRFRAPYIVGVRGLAMKDKTLGALIDIAPENGEEGLVLLLHEIAHIANDFGPMKPGNYATRAPGSWIPSQFWINAVAKNAPRESTSDQQAREWLEYAREHQVKGSKQIPGQLAALLEWWPPEIKTMIDNAVTTAIQTLKKDGHK